MKSVEGSTVEPYQDPLLYEDITEPKAAYWDAAKRGMYNVVNAANGTGRKAFIGTSYRVAGKSGTAQVFSLKENQTYDASGLKKNCMIMLGLPLMRLMMILKWWWRLF